MKSRFFSRRDFLKTASSLSMVTAFGGGIPTDLFASEGKLVRFPEKTDLILLTSRPPQLETPKHFFKELITPNEALFVRWHIANIPTSVDLRTWRIKVGGNTKHPLELSMDDLKGLPKVTYTAVIQCAGNGRSFFNPRVPGGQWGNGAMGNITWGGVRLKDILAKAGVKGDSVEVAFNGLDSGPLPTVPDLVKSLPVDKALEEDIIIAYEMNGKQLTMLNGFPARLVVPGWYASYWVKALSDVTVLSKPLASFWMDPAYRIPANPCACVPPGTKPDKTVPITRMDTSSLIIEPSEGNRLPAGKEVTISGLAFSGGYGIKDVIVSVDGGKTWKEAKLGEDLGKYSWILWSLPWKPTQKGKYSLMARATNSIGESHPLDSLWNPSGYMLNNIEKVDVIVG